MVKAMSGGIEPATLRRKTFSGHGLELVVSQLVCMGQEYLVECTLSDCDYVRIEASYKGICTVGRENSREEYR